MSWILVIDDDDDIREVILLLLGLEGYEAIGACDGVEALDRIGLRGEPALILLDLRMPRMSGSEFVRALRQKSSHAAPPIVVVSGDLAAHDYAASIGALGCLRKPVELQDLVAMVARAIAAHARP
jgi:CheY-like chemotaxis protein